METACATWQVDVNTMPELDGEVFVLNGDNFASTLASHDVALVKFYAPWYGALNLLGALFGTRFVVAGGGLVRF